MNSTERTQHWQQHIEHWRDTGLSGAAFCKQQSLSYHQFAYWRRKLEDVVDATDTERVPTSGFARVTHVAASPVSGDLTLRLPGGMTITGLHAGNVELLGAVLRQL
ncbi:IS66 family insertion sequence element accessory protein TnpB [Amphritea sp.]|uniref:IS66 family insertion sequence element accessory protein TnpA n=1 Tax=Amphritea sp. TaxID=1872502 RepID=UPI00356580BC